MDEFLRLLLTGAPNPEPLGSVEDWWTGHRRWLSRFPLAADVALAGGFSADRLAYAFASGYHAALCALLPGLPRERRYALCATEAGGGRPSSMKTRLLGPEQGPFQLEGVKTYVTLGTHAEELLVVARQGEDAQGRARLRLARVDARRAGVTLTGMPPPPFVPELPHAQVRLHAVTPEAVLPGDGYALYLKPFRTVEDCHVFAAVLGWLLQVGRRSGWPDEVREELLALAVTLRSLAQADPASPAVHLALAGALDLCRARVEALEPLWERVDAPTRERWQRDRPLLDVAGMVRTLRRDAAREKLQSEG